jgi:hypothetical protein
MADIPPVAALLPPRSMVGHLPLEQVIGVRIPGGQPKIINKNAPSSEVRSKALLVDWYCFTLVLLFRDDERR